MRIAAIYDIHSNLPALEVVLDEIRREKVDQIIVGGDVVPRAIDELVSSARALSRVGSGSRCRGDHAR